MHECRLGRVDPPLTEQHSQTVLEARERRAIMAIHGCRKPGLKMCLERRGVGGDHIARMLHGLLYRGRLLRGLRDTFQKGRVDLRGVARLRLPR